MATLNTPKKKLEFATNHELCGPCKMDDKHLDAAGFCSFCRHFLCKSCFAYHKKLGKIHSLQTLGQMTSERAVSRSSLDPCLETCQHHKHKVLEIYCKTHDEVCCIICVTTNHKQCDYAYIPEFTDTLSTSPNNECTAILNTIQALIGQFDGIKTESGNKVKDLDRQRREFGSAVRKLKKEIETIIEQLEKQIVGEMRQLFDRETKQLASNIDKCDDALRILHETYAKVEEARESDGRNLSFAVNKKSTKIIRDNSATLKALRKDTYQFCVKFEDNPEIIRSLRKIKSLGKLKFKRDVSKPELEGESGDEGKTINPQQNGNGTKSKLK